ncbi:unnamed protein product, partial [Amoebophrya sp. A25]
SVAQDTDRQEGEELHQAESEGPGQSNQEAPSPPEQVDEMGEPKPNAEAVMEEKLGQPTPQAPSPGPPQEPAPPVEVKLKEESDSDRPPPAATGLATADRGKLVGPVVVPSPPPPAAPAAPEEPGKDEPANDPHQTPKVHPAGSPLAPG